MSTRPKGLLVFILVAKVCFSMTRFLVHFRHKMVILELNLLKIGTELSSRDNNGSVKKFLNKVAAAII